MLSGGNIASQQQEKHPVLMLNDIRHNCVYEVTGEDGPTDYKFSMKLIIDGKTFIGKGPSKRAAKGACAMKALKHAGINPNAAIFKAQQALKQKNSQSKQAYIKKAPNQVDGGYQWVNGKKICRLYLNNLCLRGNQCPYIHPEYSGGLQTQLPAYSQVLSKDTYSWLQFCENFLHLRCSRPDCKFLHVSLDDEKIFRASGKIPPHIVEQAVRKAIADESNIPGASPPCKAFFDGQCQWYSCPFRHISKQQFSREVLDSLLQHFSKNCRLQGNYRLNTNGLFDTPRQEKEMYGHESQSHVFARRILDEPVGLDNRLADMRKYDIARPHVPNPDMLVKGMHNLMKDNEYTQKEMQQMREDLRLLHEENETLRNSIRVNPANEGPFLRKDQLRGEEGFFKRGESDIFRRGMPKDDNYYSQRGLPIEEDRLLRRGIPREEDRFSRREMPRVGDNYFKGGEDNFFRSGQPKANYQEREILYDDHLRRLKEENEDMRKIINARRNERIESYQELEHRNHVLGNPLYREGIFEEAKLDMRQLNPVSHFNEHRIRGMGNQMMYNSLGVPVPLTMPPLIQQKKQVFNQQIKLGKIQNAGRPSFQNKNQGHKAQNPTRPSHVINKGNKNQGQIAKWKRKNVKKTNPQKQPQQQKQQPQQQKQQPQQQKQQPQQQRQQQRPKKKQENQKGESALKEKPDLTVDMASQNKPIVIVGEDVLTEERKNRNTREETTEKQTLSEVNTSPSDAVSFREALENIQDEGEHSDEKSEESEECHQDKSHKTEECDGSADVVVENHEEEERDHESSHEEGENHESSHEDEEKKHERSYEAKDGEEENAHHCKEKNFESSYQKAEKDHESSLESGEESYLSAETEERSSAASE